MRRILFFYFFFFTSLIVFAQIKDNRYTRNDSIYLEKENTWAVGAGLTNFIMHGDLRSIGTGNQGNFWNFGAYAYVDKMFNPILGLEFKLNYNNISGGAQYFSDVYDVLYVDDTQITDNLFFEGRAIGAEMSLIISFSNWWRRNTDRWHIAGHFGMGYNQYNSTLFQRNPDGSATQLVDFGFNPARDRIKEASSINLNLQTSIKYRLNKRIDLELRPAWYFNYEDHIDATISNKQNWETFFVTHLGVVVKLGKQEKYTIWGNDADAKRDSIQEPAMLKLNDTDQDGVIDQFDIEPNTPVGVMVYGNGAAIDSDGDGLPDHEDLCKFEPGPKNNDGCPITGDIDKDGIADRKDKCLNEKGLEKYEGCPDAESLKLTEIVEVLSYSKNIYFDTDSNQIRNAVYYSMLDEVATIMLANPNVSFSVSGYTDDRAPEEYNQKLSERRANEARLYLVARGVEPDRVTAQGYGELNPRYDNSTEQGRQLNRRVEIKSVGPYEKKTRIIRDKN